MLLPNLIGLDATTTTETAETAEASAVVVPCSKEELLSKTTDKMATLEFQNRTKYDDMVDYVNDMVSKLLTNVEELVHSTQYQVLWELETVNPSSDTTERKEARFNQLIEEFETINNTIKDTTNILKEKFQSIIKMEKLYTDHANIYRDVHTNEKSKCLEEFSYELNVLNSVKLVWESSYLIRIGYKFKLKEFIEDLKTHNNSTVNENPLKFKRFLECMGLNFTENNEQLQDEFIKGFNTEVSDSEKEEAVNARATVIKAMEDRILFVLGEEREQISFEQFLKLFGHPDTPLGLQIKKFLQTPRHAPRVSIDDSKDS